MKQILTIKLQLLLAFLLFGTAQQAQAQWTGTWSTNIDDREIRIVQASNGNVTFGLGDYSFSGKTTKNRASLGQTVTGTYFISPGFLTKEKPLGAYKKPVDHDKYGDRGTFTMTIDANGQTFKGEWVNAADASKKGPLTGRRINQISASAIADADKKEELSKKRVDVSGIKPQIPWVGTWKVSDDEQWKIIVVNSKKIRIKGARTTNGQLITIDAELTEELISSDGRTTTYRGTFEELNNSTKKKESGSIYLDTSNTDYNRIEGTRRYPNQHKAKSPRAQIVKGLKAERISSDKPNMNSYR